MTVSCLSCLESKVYLFYTELYSYMWCAWLYYNFPYHLTNGTIFIKNVFTIKCVL